MGYFGFPLLACAGVFMAKPGERRDSGVSLNHVLYFSLHDKYRDRDYVAVLTHP